MNATATNPSGIAMPAQNSNGGTAVCYVRTADTNAESLIRTHLRHLHDYADRLGLTVAEDYVDIAYASGRLDRPEFKQMIQRCIDDPAIKFCLVLNLTALSRLVTSLDVVVTTLNHHGVAIRSRDGDGYDLQTLRRPVALETRQ